MRGHNQGLFAVSLGSKRVGKGYGRIGQALGFPPQLAALWSSTKSEVTLGLEATQQVGHGQFGQLPKQGCESTKARCCVATFNLIVSTRIPHLQFNTAGVRFSKSTLTTAVIFHRLRSANLDVGSRISCLRP